MLDTNILIRFLNGDAALTPLLEGAERYISFLTEIELFCKPDTTPAEAAAIQELTDSCTIIPYREEMREIIIHLRRRYRLKMPDAFICATAVYYQLPLCTFDKALHPIEELDFVSPQ